MPPFAAMSRSFMNSSIMTLCALRKVMNTDVAGFFTIPSVQSSLVSTHMRLPMSALRTSCSTSPFGTLRSFVSPFSSLSFPLAEILSESA